MASSNKNPNRKSAAKRRTGAQSRPVGKATSLLLRDIDPEVLDVMRARAERAGRSLQQELHIALRRDAGRNFDEARAVSDQWREKLAGRKLPDTTALIRADRER
ncbi:MAG: hypothetical protein KDA32_10315 [Phycisphaerales bacterium]|nr:hypothetical protein [Phycisphaerales bacterium]